MIILKEIQVNVYKEHWARGIDGGIRIRLQKNVLSGFTRNIFREE